MSIILFDVDNTLADMDHRLPLIDGANPDWDAFEADCDQDPLIVPTAEILIAFQNLGHRIWLWTGRSDNVKAKTVHWLQVHALPYHQLLMRPYGDMRPTEKVKREWLNHSPIPKDQVLCCYDDDPRIIKMLQEEGMHAYQVKRPDII